jgi:hypothetical protein
MAMNKKERKHFNRMVDRLTRGKDTECKTCHREMVPMEFVLRKGECLICKSLKEIKTDGD